MEGELRPLTVRTKELKYTAFHVAMRGRERDMSMGVDAANIKVPQKDKKECQRGG